MKKKITAMIPARMGSKRVPKKNLRFIHGKPLIKYPVDISLESRVFDEIWVNTECAALKPIVESWGVNFHERPAECASDTATPREFVYEFLKRHECDYVVQVNPTSPLLRVETVHKFISFIEENDYDSILTTVEDKAETFYEGKPLNFSLAEKVNSQFLPIVEKTIWALSAWKRKSFLDMQDNGINPIFGGKLARFAIPKDESCDLDTQEDWNIAEGALEAREHNYEAKYLEV
jgi:CMP-N-acetylneuraminic acid synthetase